MAEGDFEQEEEELLDYEGSDYDEYEDVEEEEVANPDIRNSAGCTGKVSTEVDEASLEMPAESGEIKEDCDIQDTGSKLVDLEEGELEERAMSQAAEIEQAEVTYEFSGAVRGSAVGKLHSATIASGKDAEQGQRKGSPSSGLRGGGQTSASGLPFAGRKRVRDRHGDWLETGPNSGSSIGMAAHLVELHHRAKGHGGPNFHPSPSFGDNLQWFARPNSNGGQRAPGSNRMLASHHQDHVHDSSELLEQHQHLARASLHAGNIIGARGGDGGSRRSSIGGGGGGGAVPPLGGLRSGFPPPPPPPHPRDGGRPLDNPHLAFLSPAPSNGPRRVGGPHPRPPDGSNFRFPGMNGGSGGARPVPVPPEERGLLGPGGRPPPAPPPPGGPPPRGVWNMMPERGMPFSPQLAGGPGGAGNHPVPLPPRDPPRKMLHPRQAAADHASSSGLDPRNKAAFQLEWTFPESRVKRRAEGPPARSQSRVPPGAPYSDHHSGKGHPPLPLPQPTKRARVERTADAREEQLAGGGGGNSRKVKEMFEGPADGKAALPLSQQQHQPPLKLPSPLLGTGRDRNRVSSGGSMFTSEPGPGPGPVPAHRRPSTHFREEHRGAPVSSRRTPPSSASDGVHSSAGQKEDEGAAGKDAHMKEARHANGHSLHAPPGLAPLPVLVGAAPVVKARTGASICWVQSEPSSEQQQLPLPPPPPLPPPSERKYLNNVLSRGASAGGRERDNFRETANFPAAATPAAVGGGRDSLPPERYRKRSPDFDRAAGVSGGGHQDSSSQGRHRLRSPGAGAGGGVREAAGGRSKERLEGPSGRPERGQGYTNGNQRRSYSPPPPPAPPAPAPAPTPASAPARFAQEDPSHMGSRGKHRSAPTGFSPALDHDSLRRENGRSRESESEDRANASFVQLGGPVSKSRSLVVSGYPEGPPPDAVADLFEKEGKIMSMRAEEAHLIVTYAQLQDAISAKRKLHRSQYLGRLISVDYSASHLA